MPASASSGRRSSPSSASSRFPTRIANERHRKGSETETREETSSGKDEPDSLASTRGQWVTSPQPLCHLRSQSTHSTPTTDRRQRDKHTPFGWASGRRSAK